MIYPDNFERKIGFDIIRSLVSKECISNLGAEMVSEMSFSTDKSFIETSLTQTREFRCIIARHEEFPLDNFVDVRDSIKRIRIEGTWMDEEELHGLLRAIISIRKIVMFLKGSDDVPAYPTLFALTEGVMTFQSLEVSIDKVLDRYGKLRDSASEKLYNIRREKLKVEGSASKALSEVLKQAQKDGFVEKDASPSLRDGRLVIPVIPGLKRKIRGIIHDESSSGKTVYIEPTEVVEANNRIRELESEERKEAIRILKVKAAEIRPLSNDIIKSYRLLAVIDFIRARALFAEKIKANEPKVTSKPYMDWRFAEHPLLAISLARHGRKTIPLDIELGKNGRIILISGPNAGGKSVCLKTVALLQYMLQCGLSVPLGDSSRAGIFKKILIDIGDEQSIDNDLSTYSSHLRNMKIMLKSCDDSTLLLIDEFGSGTEPQIGGAIAEAILHQMLSKKSWGVITTHYQNLKHYADSHEGVVNGAMLYDRKEMRPLYKLSIGRPGSSFAIEIARQIGLPDDVIRYASDIVGSEYIQSDKYLQDIVRDKRYWENKRQTIHQREKELERMIEKYEKEIAETRSQRREILDDARKQAEDMLDGSNRIIENTIREIKETQAARNETRRIREELESYRKDIAEKERLENEEKIARKIDQIEKRRERHKERKARLADENRRKAEAPKEDIKHENIEIGSHVRIKGLSSVGQVTTLDKGMATIVFGDMRTKMPTDRLELAACVKESTKTGTSRMTRDTIDERHKQFKQELDIRGLRADEALLQVQYFIDDAIIVGASQLRILHGKGNGILRQLVRQYLSCVPNIRSYRDEHVQFGGAGITVVEIG